MFLQLSEVQFSKMARNGIDRFLITSSILASILVLLPKTRAELPEFDLRKIFSIDKKGGNSEHPDLNTESGRTALLRVKKLTIYLQRPSPVSLLDFSVTFKLAKGVAVAIE